MIIMSIILINHNGRDDENDADDNLDCHKCRDDDGGSGDYYFRNSETANHF